MEFEIFKVGKHTSSNGVEKEYSLDDLKFIAESYKPDDHEAPIVVGHPVDNSPAFGWIESLKVKGDKLLAKAKDIVPEFMESLKKKVYKKRSISLDKDGKLRHVGFLGGAAPAVKGLADIEFNEEDVSITIENEFDVNEFEAPTPEPSQQPPPKSADGKPKNIDSEISDKLNDLKNRITNLQTSFTENNDGLKELTNLNSKIDDLRFKINLTEFEPSLNEKVKSGNLTPAMKSKVLSLLNYMNSLNFSDENTFDSFRSNVMTFLSDFIDSIPKIVHLQNFAEKPDDDIVEDSADYSGLPVDEQAEAIHRKALTLMKKDDISYLSAINKLTMNN